MQGSVFSDRVFLMNKSMRDALWKFSERGIASDEHSGFLELLEQLPPDHHAKSLLPFVRDAVSCKAGLEARPEWRKLLMCLASTAPVSQLMRPVVWPVVDQLMSSASEGSPDLLFAATSQLAECSPVLSRFLQPYFQRPSFAQRLELPTDVHDLLAAIRRVSELALRVESGGATGTAAATPPGQSSYEASLAAGLPPAQQWRSREEAFLRTGAFGGPPCVSWTPTAHGGSHVSRPIPRYVMDGKPWKTGSVPCTKHKDQHKVLVPGLLVVFCGSCRKCLYFQVRIIVLVEQQCIAALHPSHGI